MNVTFALAWLRYGAERLGWPGMLGLALGAVATVAGLAVVHPLETSSQALRARIAALHAQLDAKSEVLPEKEAHTLASLPGGSALMPLVAAVHAGARQRQITLDHGEYVWQRETGSQAARYRMIFPARGTYGHLRGWTADLLAARPELALEEFDLRRENIGSEAVEARVQFSVRVEDRT